MRKHIPHTLLACLCLLFPCFLPAQQPLFNLNINNGLPSNHVYYTLKDRSGYLWISTNRGVVRYNGYEYKLFDLSSGIGNDDVWHMYEDRRGRIWLSAISNEMGYIYQGNYHKLVLPAGITSFYPSYITDYDKGIIFLNGDSHHTLYIEKQDSITGIPIPLPFEIAFLQKNDSPVLRSGYDYIRLHVSRTGIRYRKCCMPPVHTSYFLHDTVLVPFPWHAGNNRQYTITDINSCAMRSIKLGEGENIYMLNENNGNCYLTGNQHVYRISKNLRIEKIFSFSAHQKYPLKSNDVLTVTEDSFWGTCIATAGNGLYIDYLHRGLPAVYDTELNGYRYIGKCGEKDYWWNKQDKMLASCSGNRGVIRFSQQNSITDIRRIFPYDTGSAVMLGDNDMYLMRNGGISDFYKNFTHVLLRLEDNSVKELSTAGYEQNFTDGIAVGAGRFFLSKIGGGYVTMQFSGDSLTLKSYPGQRYTNVLYDAFYKAAIAYGSNALLIYKDGRQLRIDARQLQLLGLKKAEQILSDNRFGNIFIKSADRLLMYNPKIRTCRELFLNYNLNSSVQLITGDTLIVAGKFGVLYCRITGPLQCSPPVVYRNIKNMAFDNISDIQYTGNGKILLHTNKGLLPVTMNDRAAASPAPAYRFLAYYNDQTYAAASHIDIDPKQKQLQFDVINPTGTGMLRYKYQVYEMGTDWQELGTDRLQLPPMQPGRTYKLAVTAYDDSWKSNPAILYVTIIPYWWQTPWGRNTLWLCGILLAVILILAVIVITKSIVTRKHAAENLRLQLTNLNMALELKSIHAQINPHFIFNTLSTALYFIKKKKLDEAYTHVSAFSDLLRAYIKSSRNKLVSIAEETENLENYILLQQARFEQKFDYHIDTCPSINTQSMLIPGMLLQPLVENAINHGLLHKEDGMGHLGIIFREQDNVLYCTIEDNGIGREKAQAYRAQTAVKTPSYGSELIRELTGIFNREGQMHIDIHYKDKKEPQTGTLVTITIKYLSQ